MLQPNLVGKSQLIEWLNKTLDLTYTKVEQCANGAAFCQIIDAIYPGTVPMQRVDFGAQLPHQNFENYKVLQEAFSKNGITQYIDVENLSKGKYMAVLEMLQWLYQYYEQNPPAQSYDPQARRHSKTRLAKPRASATRTMTRKTDSPGHSGPTPVISSRKPKTPSSSSKSLTSKSDKEQSSSQPIETSSTEDKEQIQQLTTEIAQLKQKVKELKTEVKGSKEQFEEMTQERDFYYDKLRRVEDFCQDHEEEQLIQNILSILYETDESLGFLPPNDDDEN